MSEGKVTELKRKCAHVSDKGVRCESNAIEHASNGLCAYHDKQTEEVEKRRVQVEQECEEYNMRMFGHKL